MARDYFHSNHLPVGTRNSDWTTLRRVRTQVMKSLMVDWPRLDYPTRDDLPVFYLATAYTYPIYVTVAPLIDEYGGYLVGSLAGDAWVIYLDIDQEFRCSLAHELIHVVLNAAPYVVTSEGLKEEDCVIRLSTLNLAVVQSWINACVDRFMVLYEAKCFPEKFVSLCANEIILE